MAIEVAMPQMGESVVEGTVTKWLVKEGDTVKEDQPLCEISTDKVDTEIPSPGAGRIAQIIAREGDTIPVGGKLAIIEDRDGAKSEESAPQPAPRAATSEAPKDDTPPLRAVRELRPQPKSVAPAFAPAESIAPAFERAQVMLIATPATATFAGGLRMAQEQDIDPTESLWHRRTRYQRDLLQYVQSLHRNDQAGASPAMVASVLLRQHISRVLLLLL